MRSKSKSIISVVLVCVLSLGVLGLVVALVRSKSDGNAHGGIIEISEQDGQLTTVELNSLSGGADIKFNGEIYRLTRDGTNKVYSYTDAENVFYRKFISINTEDGTYTQWSEKSEDYVSKTTLANLLKGYVKDYEMDNALSDYMKDADVNDIIGAALTNYMTSVEMQNLLTNALASYVKNSDGKGLVNMYYLYNQLTFKANTLYAVQGFDNTQNLADFTIVGGGKDGKTGRFALVFIGDKINKSLVVYQTGSILLSDLAGTSGGSTGIKPASNGYLRVFEIGGKVF
ncbi:unknown [Acidiphilium sp. CAG:727]|nr:unknown [Acidiphilium sp. CAG:727]